MPAISTRTLHAAVLAAVFVGAPARAQERQDEARAAFRDGAALIEQAEWARALAAFERSFAVRPHALTLYNIGVCQRFIGSYTLARETLQRALTRASETDEMPSLFVTQTRTYLTELEGSLARFEIAVSPKETRVAIDGRPLAPVDGKPGLFVAGIAEGAPRSVGVERFEVLADPRAVVLTFSLDGYDTIEIRKQPKPGSQELIPVSMAEQPAQLKIASNVPRAIVRVDGVDVGLSPVLVSRPPGPRVVSVTNEGFVPYEAKVTLKPGQLFPLDARLEPERTPLTKKWWFWASAIGVVAAAGAVTYVLVRPEPTRPEPDAGRLGWIANVPPSQ